MLLFWDSLPNVGDVIGHTMYANIIVIYFRIFSYINKPIYINCGKTILCCGWQFF